MRTECKQARFEFHGLFQRKVKARFDGGKITSDAGVLLLREVERGTGLIAGLAECFRDHRDRGSAQIGVEIQHKAWAVPSGLSRQPGPILRVSMKW